MKRILSALLCVVLVLFSVSGCNKKDNQTITSQLTEEPATLDPQIAHGSDAATLIAALYEGLCRVDAEGKVQPGVAESWEANSDNTQFTFHLRKDAVWNGNVPSLTEASDASDDTPTPVTAADFIFAWQRALDPATGSSACAPLLCIENAAAIHAGQKQPSELGVSAPDDHTLVVKLSQSRPDFPAQTASPCAMPCNEAFFEYAAGQYGLDRASILGNGPFTIKRYGWNHGSDITLVRASAYHGAQDALPASLKFTIGTLEVDADMSGAPSEAADTESGASNASSGTPKREIDTVTALENGTVDAAPLPVESVEDAKSAGLSVNLYTDTTWGLCFNASGKFQSTGLRKAFVQALDRGKLMSLLPANTQQAEDILPPAVQFNGKSYREQAGSGFYMRSSGDAAAQYAAQKPGDLKLTLLCTDENKGLASQMLANWNDTFHMYFSLEAVSKETLLDRVASGNYDAALYPLTPAAADASTALSAFLSSQNTNPALLKDTAFDHLLNQASTVQQLAAAEKYLCDNAVFYPLYYESHAYATAKGVTGVWSHGFDGGMDFRAAVKAG